MGLAPKAQTLLPSSLREPEEEVPEGRQRAKYNPKVPRLPVSYPPGAQLTSTHHQAGQVQGIHPQQRWVQEEKLGGRGWQHLGMGAKAYSWHVGRISPAIPPIPSSVPTPSLPKLESSQMLVYG